MHFLPHGWKLKVVRADYSLNRTIIGSLQYATITPSELSFSVTKVCQFMSAPLESHWTEVKCILHYQKGIYESWPTCQPASSAIPVQLNAYFDADWASNPDNRRSTWGSCFFFGLNSRGPQPHLFVISKTNSSGAWRHCTFPQNTSVLTFWPKALAPTQFQMLRDKLQVSVLQTLAQPPPAGGGHVTVFFTGYYSERNCTV